MAAKNESIWTKIGTGVAVAMCVAIIWLVVDMRDFVKYKQPATDQRQDVDIKTISKNVYQIDSMQCEKNKSTQSRINSMQDIARRLEFKMDILLENNIDAQRKIEEMSKYMKQDQITKNE
jgi:uncharacterized membrane protein YhiD involved in acid resistance